MGKHLAEKGSELVDAELVSKDDFGNSVYPHRDYCCSSDAFLPFGLFLHNFQVLSRYLHLLN